MFACSYIIVSQFYFFFCLLFLSLSLLFFDIFFLLDLIGCFRQASVALNVWQPEIVRGRQKQLVEQCVVPAESRLHALEMELRLCKQQILGLEKAYVSFIILLCKPIELSSRSLIGSQMLCLIFIFFFTFCVWMWIAR